MKKNLLLGVFSLLLFSCISNVDKNLEQAQFYLDQGEFGKAVDLVEPILDDQPSNNRAKFILASALIGDFALTEKKACPNDTGYLGLLACLLDDKESGDTLGFKTFARIAPDDNSHNEDISRAVSLLESITEFTPDFSEKDVALQRLVSRAFDVSSLFLIAGANSENVACNDGTPGVVDDVPDDYDVSNITSANAASFINNIEQIEVDAKLVGFNADFNLISRAKDIQEELDSYGISTTAAVRLLFDNNYFTPAQQVCN